MAIQGVRRYLAALAFGMVAAGSMPPLSLWPALLVAMPVFIWLLDGIVVQPRAKLAQARTAFGVGWFFGSGFFLVSLYWVGAAFLVDAQTYAWMMPLAIVVLVSGMALYWGIAAFAASLFWSEGLSRIFFFSAILASSEWLRGHLFTGFPWNAVGYAAQDINGLSQLAANVGIWGVTLFVILLAATPACFNGRRSGTAEYLTLAFLAALALGTIGWGYGRLANARPAWQPDINIRIVQPNVPQSDKWRYDNAAAIFDQLLEMSDSSKMKSEMGEADVVPNVVVWPESAVPFLVDEHPVALSAIADVLLKKKILLMGGLRRVPQGVREANIYNSLLVIDAKGSVLGTYDKWHLVPYGEYLPFENLLTPLGMRRLVSIPGSFAHGPGPQTIGFPGVPPFSPLICYEAIFAHEVVEQDHRPQWLLNITNDGWFGLTSGPYQHLVQARFRAIEEGLPMVRAANTGISAIIDPYGQVSASLPLGTSGVLDSRLPQPLPPTFYSMHGDLIFAILLLFTVVFATISRVFFERNSRFGCKKM